MKEEEIRAVILEEIKEVSHVDIAELDENLFGDRCCIVSVNSPTPTTQASFPLY